MFLNLFGAIGQVCTIKRGIFLRQCGGDLLGHVGRRVVFRRHVILHACRFFDNYTQYQYLACFLNLPFFHYSGFLALQGRFLNFSRFSPLFLKFSKTRKKKLQKKTFYCTFWYILVTPPIILTFWLNGPLGGKIQMGIYFLFLHLNILSIAFLIPLDILKFVS